MGRSKVLAPEERLSTMGWPWALAKATEDAYVYTVGLRDGSCIHFREATEDAHGLWVTLQEVQSFHGPIRERMREVAADGGYPVLPVRGICVRVADIVWAIDGYE